MALQFEEAEFQEAYKEIDEPQLEGGWELFTDISGIQIYRLYDKRTGLYKYKIFGGLSNCTPELCADVYMDLKYRKSWDEYVKELSEKVYDGKPVIYWEVKYPFPMSNRDYVYVRERRDLDVDGRKIWVILAKSASVAQCPEKSGVIRVCDYKQSLAIESDGGSGIKVFMNYFDNPGGSIPSWLINWAAKSGVPSFITDLQKACNNYPSNCKQVKT
ncbi:phosphatidylcholine transfer protein isoform X1 [Acipenser ruthenus]|uniref:phosphatidylcholine transfer protein isoform X1 n=2 Tax=Acipenser ruthenus TaxID=7906 RepID=UPI00274051AB|nr:phosphatidylcholine transfer protein isoform X1 [Acipenser ruthenus]